MKVRQYNEAKINIRLKLVALWATIMFLYLYADFFELMVPGSLEAMMKQQTPVGETTPGLLVIFGSILIIPALMPFLSAFLKASLARWANMIIGGLWSLMSFALIIGYFNDVGGWYTFYVIFKSVEVIVFFYIVYTAYHWPKVSGDYRLS